MANFTGTAGNDSLTGTSGDDTFNLSQGGNDTASGLTGSDVFEMGGAFSAQDAINGGAGNDTVVLDGNYTSRVTFGANTMTGVETLKLTSTFGYKLTTADATVAAGQTLTVDGSTLGAADYLSFDGSKEKDGAFVLNGGAGNDAMIDGAGNDVISGGAGADTIYLVSGGSDIAKGGDGNDLISIGGTLSAKDAIDGGTGVDTVQLDGNYPSKVIFAAGTMTNVERLDVVGNFSYRLAFNDATIAKGASLFVDAGSLTAGHSLILDDSAETDGKLSVRGGAGDDAINGGSHNDVANFTAGGNDTFFGLAGDDVVNIGAAYTQQDKINGGNGNDTLILAGNYANGITLSSASITSVETFIFGAGFNYNFTATQTGVNDNRITIDGSALGAANSLTFDASAETHGQFFITGGAGNDHLVGANTASGPFSGDTFDLTKGGNDFASGGAGNDTFTLGATLTAQDSIDGGAGNDTLLLNGDYSHGVVFGAQTVVNVERIDLASGHNYALTTNDSTVAAGATLAVILSSGSANTLHFDGSAETNGNFTASGGSGDDVITGGAGRDTLIGVGGNDVISGGGGNDVLTPDSPFDGFLSSSTVFGGAGNDTINMNHGLDETDRIDGGTGNDTVVLDNPGFPYSVTFDPATMVNVEHLVLQSSDPSDSHYSLTMSDGNVAAGQTLSVTVDPNVDLIFDGSAETDGSYDVTGSTMNDTLTGGTKADVLSGGEGADIITGGGGADLIDAGRSSVPDDNEGAVDTICYTQASDSTGLNFDTITNFETANDLISVPSFVNAFAPAVVHSLSSATFNSDLSAIAANMGAHSAVLFTETSGEFARDQFLVVDVNGVAGYQVGGDFVIEISFAPGTAGSSPPPFTVSNFTT